MEGQPFTSGEIAGNRHDNVKDMPREKRLVFELASLKNYVRHLEAEYEQLTGRPYDESLAEGLLPPDARPLPEQQLPEELRPAA